MSGSIHPEENNNITQKIEQELTRVEPKIFDGIKKEKKQQLIKSFALTIQKVHIGPLPDPETLKEYSEIIPNGAERIMAMAEKQSNHRMYLEKKVVSGQVQQSYIGQAFALVIGLAALAAATYTISTGHEWAGGALGLGGITGLVTAFIQGRRKQENNLQEKSIHPKRS
jgi:uncharacterized membrane protein